MTQQRATARPAVEALEGRDAPAMVVAVFPGTPGLWMRYLRPGAGYAWIQLTANTPSQLTANSRGEILADFDSQGLWYYAVNACGWVQVTANDPDLIAIGNMPAYGGSNSDVFAAFDGQGLWRAFATPQRGRGTWQCLTWAEPSQIDAGVTSLAADFDGNGLWTWSPNQGWCQVTAADPSDIGLTEYLYGNNNRFYAGYLLAADFDALGVWSLRGENSTTREMWTVRQPPFTGGAWRQISTLDPYDLDAGGPGGTIAAFTGAYQGMYLLSSAIWSPRRITWYPVGSLSMTNVGEVYATLPGYFYGWQMWSPAYEGSTVVTAQVPALFAVA